MKEPPEGFDSVKGNTDGTDVCMNEKDEVVPCGFGSSIMQFFGGGGLEPKSIQSDNCWL